MTQLKHHPHQLRTGQSPYIHICASTSVYPLKTETWESSVPSPIFIPPSSLSHPTFSMSLICICCISTLVHSVSYLVSLPVPPPFTFYIAARTKLLNKNLIIFSLDWKPFMGFPMHLKTKMIHWLTNPCVFWPLSWFPKSHLSLSTFQPIWHFDSLNSELPNIFLPPPCRNNFH